MKKTEALLDVIDSKDKDFITEINDIKNCNFLIKSPLYEFGLTKACQIDDLNKLRVLKQLFCNNDLIWSNYYEYTINKLISISNLKRLNKLVLLVTNINLLNSKHYKFAIEKVCKAKNMFVLNPYISILTSKSLLDSKYYKYLFNRTIYFKNSEICNLIIKILTILDNSELDNKSKFFDQINDIFDKNNESYIIYYLNSFMVNLNNITSCKIYIKKPSN